MGRHNRLGPPLSDWRRPNRIRAADEKFRQAEEIVGMSKSMEITNLLVHISLLKQIIRNFEAMAKLSDDPTRREEYKGEAEEVRKESLTMSDAFKRCGRAKLTDRADAALKQPGPLGPPCQYL